MSDVVEPGLSAREPPSGDAKPVVVYLTMGLSLGILLAIQTAQQQFGADVFSHLAALRELSQDPLDPSNPFVRSADPTYHFTPYLVALGLFANVTGLEPLMALNVGAFLNFIVLLIGIWMFARTFGSHRWTPHLALLFSLVAWGIDSWRWSGFWNLNSIGFTLGYPSMFACGLALLTLVGLARHLSKPGWGKVAAIAISSALIVTNHPFTALWFSIGAAAIVGVHRDSTLPRRAGSVLLPALLALLLVFLWPYYPIEELASQAGASGSLWPHMYQSVLRRGFLLIPGALALLYRARRSLRDPLIWLFLGSAAVYGLGLLAGSSGLGRVIPGLALAGHVALADLAAELLSMPRRRVLAGGLVAAIGVIGLVGSAPGVVRMVPREILPAAVADDERLEPEVAPYTSLSEHLSPDDVVLAAGWMRRVVPAIEGRVVLPGQLTPLLEDRPAREADHSRFFRNTTTLQQRSAIADRWNVSLVIVEADDLARFPWLPDAYPLVAETDDYAVYSIETP